MSDTGAILDNIRIELDSRGFFTRNPCTCRTRCDKVLTLARSGCDLNIRLGGRAGHRQSDVHLYDGKVHDQRIYNFDWTLGLTDMQIRQLVDCCEELAPKWQGKMMSCVSLQVGTKQSKSGEGRGKELRQDEIKKHWESFRNNDDENELRKVLIRRSRVRLQVG